MAMFKTIVHPTDFDEPSKEAFRAALSLAGVLGARLVVFHVVPPPAIVTDDGRVILDPCSPEPIDLWAEYRPLQAAAYGVPAHYVVVVGHESEARRLLEEKVREMGEGTLVVMGSHARRGIRRLLWGSKTEEVVRECPCPVLVVKAPSPKEPAVSEVGPGCATSHSASSSQTNGSDPGPLRSSGCAANEAEALNPA
jgi:nucleotide-binding universal stress UspA family protein